MRKLKVFISICLLSTALPTSAFASYLLDQDHNGVDIQDVVKAINNSQGASVITGHSTFIKADILNLLSQIPPFMQGQQTSQGTVTGLVLDETGAAVIDAQVSLDGTNLVTQTDSTGHFEFNIVPVIYQTTIHVTKNGYQQASSGVFNLLNGGTRNMDSLVLSRIPVPAYGSISVNVVSTTGDPIESVQIRVKGTETTGYTNASGNFTFDGLLVGTYILQVSAENYMGQDITVIVTPSEHPPVSVTLTQQLVNVEGYAKSSTGEMITSTQVTIPGTTYTAYINESGKFTFYNMPAGYRIQALAIADYQPLQLIDVTVSPTVNSIGTLTFIPVATLRGIVMNNITGLPVMPDVMVTLQATDGTYTQSVLSDANGSYLFSNLPLTTTYTLTVEKESYILNPLSAFTVNRGQNYSNLYLQKGAAVHTESDLLAALADTDVPYILLLNDIHLSSPLLFTRDVRLSGVNGNIQLTAPGFTIASTEPYPLVGWSQLNIYSDVGNNETLLQAALNSFLSKIKVTDFGGYTGFINRVSQQNYFLSDGVENLTAFVNNAEGLGNALANNNVTTIYVAANIYSNGNLDFANRSVHLISRSERTIRKDSYSNTSQVQLTNIILLQS